MNVKNRINPGDIVELFEQKRLMSALCLGLKKDRLNLITESSKLLTLSPSRVIHQSPGRLNPATPRKDAIEFLREISRIRDKIARNIDLELLWKSIESKGRFLDLSDVYHQSQASFDASEDDAIAGMLRAIYSNRCFFRYSDGRVYVSTEEEVHSELARQEEEKKENALIDELVEWLEMKAQTSSVETPVPNGYQRFVEALKADVARIAEPPDKNFLTSILKRISRTPNLSSFDFLVLLGEFDPDENLDFIRLRYPKSFSDKALMEIDLLIKNPFESSSEHLDLTDLSCFTIDGPQTQDFDDAISCVHRSDGRTEIGIHITDVTWRIHPGTFLDEEARERGQTLYLPPRTWHMFPSIFAETIAGLREGVTQPAISVLVTMSPSFEIEDVQFRLSTIRVSKRWTYDEVDDNLESEPFCSLLKIAGELKRKRQDNGAIIMPRPEITLDARNPRLIVIQRRNRQSPSQLIVSEMMILANTLVAQHAAQSKVPFPYRCQQTLNEQIPKSEDEFNPYIAYCQRRLMPRAEQSIEPKSHFTLGLSSYTNFTSPMRRYFDILAQRQFKAILGYDDPYTKEELIALMNELEASVSRASTISYHQHRYWLLKYLSGCQGQTFKATVLDRFSNGYQIWLNELCMDADLPLSFGHKLYAEQVVSVIIEKVSARGDILKLRLAD